MEGPVGGSGQVDAEIAVGLRHETLSAAEEAEAKAEQEQYVEFILHYSFCRTHQQYVEQGDGERYLFG